MVYVCGGLPLPSSMETCTSPGTLPCCAVIVRVAVVDDGLAVRAGRRRDGAVRVGARLAGLTGNAAGLAGHLANAGLARHPALSRWPGTPPCPPVCPGTPVWPC
ncbi:hypothetical protein GCM10018954_030970 [Kutzneria kofuensis]